MVLVFGLAILVSVPTTTTATTVGGERVLPLIPFVLPFILESLIVIAIIARDCRSIAISFPEVDRELTERLVERVEDADSVKEKEEESGTAKILKMVNEQFMPDFCKGSYRDGVF